MVELEVRSPVTEEVIKRYKKADDNEVTYTMRKARTALLFWKLAPLSHRMNNLSALKKVIVGNMDEIAARLSQVTGKVQMESLFSDVYPVIETLAWYEKNAARVLGTRSLRLPSIFGKTTAVTEQRPVGVALVIAPSDYPFQKAMVPVISALAAGNTVILKPSERSLDIGKLISIICRTAGIPEYVVQVVYGNGETGRKLIEAQPDAVFFSGSVVTGREVAAEAARSFVPAELRLRGKDAMIVFGDANLPRAVEAAAYGALANSGQGASALGKFYVQETVYEEFLRLLVERVKNVNVGHTMHSDMGAMISPEAVAAVENHINDARRKGAIALTEIKSNGNFVYPVVLKNVHHGMKLMKEEAHGPVLPVMQFTSEEDAIELANEEKNGLGAGMTNGAAGSRGSVSVWTNERSRAGRVIAQLKADACVVNDVIKNAASAALSFGISTGSVAAGRAVKRDNSFQGPDGISAFTRVVPVVINNSSAVREAYWFPYTREFYEQMATFLRMLNSATSGVFRLASLIRFNRYLRQRRSF